MLSKRGYEAHPSSGEGPWPEKARIITLWSGKKCPTAERKRAILAALAGETAVTRQKSAIPLR